MKKRRFIFLDIDGVLNYTKWYDSLQKMDKEDQRKYLHNLEYPIMMHLCPESVQLLNQLDECEIIISSSWGYKPSVVNGLKARGLKLPIIGGTTHYHINDESLCRGNEIAKWFIDNNIDKPPKDNYALLYGDGKWFHTSVDYNLINGEWKNTPNDDDIEYTYVILDDEDDMLLQQRKHFIHINSFSGITQEDINKAKKILNISL